MTVGEKIKSARKKAGLTQKQLGERLGITFQSVAQWETGKRIPKIETLQKIADALCIDVHYFTEENAEIYEDGVVILLDSSLTNDERERVHLNPNNRLRTLLSLYDKLNSVGQDSLVRYAMELIAAKDFTKGAKGFTCLFHDSEIAPIDYEDDSVKEMLQKQDEFTLKLCQEQENGLHNKGNTK